MNPGPLDPFPGHTINPSSPRGVSQALLHPFTAVCSPPPASARTSQGGSVLKETDPHTKFSRPQDRPAHSLSHCLQVGRMGHWAETWSCILTLPATPPTPPPSSCHYILELLPSGLTLSCTMGLLPLCLGLVGGHIHIKDACNPCTVPPAIFCDCCQPC